MTGRSKKIVTFGILVLVFVVLSLTPPISGFIKTNASSVFTPIVKAVSAVGRKISQIWTVTFYSKNVVSEKVHLEEELQALKAEKAIFENDLARMKSLHEQLEQLNMIEDFSFEIYPADIIGWEPDIWYSTVLINRGSRDGIGKGTLVTQGDKLVGRIIEVKRGWSRVRLLTDRRSVVPALVKGKRVKGIVVTTSRNRLKLDYLDDAKDVMKGDVIITSKANHKYEDEEIIFPEGLIIGTVTSMEREDKGWYSASIEPAVDFSKLEKVSVIVIK